jgi:hypothetical protein
MLSTAPAIGSSRTISAAPAFLLATELQPDEPAWREAEAHAGAVASSCASILGFEPAVRLAAISAIPERHEGEASLLMSIGEAVAAGANEIFVLPTALDFNLFQREMIGHLLAEARRLFPDAVIHHDDVDPGHPLLVECLADQVARTLTRDDSPQHTGLVLAASGHGDANSRAQSYRLMRLVWERLGLGAGEVGFLRHGQPFLGFKLDQCGERALQWILLSQTQWRTEHFEFAEVILGNYQCDHPDAVRWRVAAPPGDHPAMTQWLAQRVTRLWTEKRAREQVRTASPKRNAAAKPSSWDLGSGIISSIPDGHALAELIERILPAGPPERVLVKVTWHGYATGTYTDPAALDLLLGALPAKAIILEGHTSSRNLGAAADHETFDWGTQARENRSWIRQQDAEFLRRTGLADVIARHHAHYVNVTEAFWDETCAPSERVHQILRERGVSLHHPEMARFIPEILLEHRGCPMISFAKFKGPTRLAISNMFGLLPEPLRAAWHGPNITYFARVCCDLAKLYGALFDLSGIDEALYTAVRWNRRGLYRSRWGNYDLLTDSGYITASRSLASADILASRLQGQDVTRSAFFDVVRAALDWDEEAATEQLPDPARWVFA